MKITVYNNHLRLLAKHFLAIVPLKEGEVKVNGKYNLISDEWGELGIVECEKVWKRHVYDIKPTETTLADGDLNIANTLQKKGLKRVDLVQIVTLHFIRRKHDQFIELLNTELPKINIYPVKQLEIG